MSQCRWAAIRRAVVLALLVAARGAPASFITFESGWPSTYSMAMNQSPSISPKSKTCAMLPWLRPITMRASFVNIEMNCLFAA